MPDTLSLTTGVSLGLLAGIVSGVCYLVANGFNKPRDDECCKKRITSSPKRRVCLQCGGDTEGGVVPCICHHHKPVKFESGAWFLRQVQRALSLMPWSISTDKLEQIEEECEPSPGTSDDRNELRSIREFLELLSAKLAGGPLERTRVAPLYDHPAYLRMFERHHRQLRAALKALTTALHDALTYLPSAHHASSVSSHASSHASSGASGAHAQLKRLVARVVEEASALPALARYAAEPSPTPTIESSTYEDLLATAILNKVIERYQTENGSGGRSSGIHSASASPSPSDRSSPRSLHSRNTREITPPLREEDDLSDWEEGEATDDAVEVPRRVPFPEFGGDIVHQDNEDRDFDEISSSDIQAVDGSWEENWLFQKKKIKTTQSVPVPMLVPNSNTEYRALIGDRDADDTTDLSDNASDTEEHIEYKSDMKKVLDSKHVIGGKPKLDEVLTDDYEPDSLMIFDGSEEFEKLYEECKDNEIVDARNIDINNEDNKNKSDNTDQTKDSVLMLDVDSGPPPKAEFNLNEEIHRSIFNGSQIGQLIDLDPTPAMAHDSLDEVDHVSNVKNFSDGTGINTLSRHERVGEYEETVAVPVQRYADSLRKGYSNDDKHYDDEMMKRFDEDSNDCAENEQHNEDDLIPGSIAYRERKKWLNYVEMPNNPYSPEAIQKRLSVKSTSSLFDSLTSRSKDSDIDTPETPTRKANGLKVETETNEKTFNGEQATEKRMDNLKKLTQSMSQDEEFVTKIKKGRSPTPESAHHSPSEESSPHKRYGRDYYVREASVSRGGRESAGESLHSSPEAAPGLLIKQIREIATNQHYTKFAGNDEIHISITTTPNNNDEILIEYEDANEHALFEAKPALVDDDTDKKFEEILQSAYKTDIDLAPLTIQTEDETKIDDQANLKSPDEPNIENSYLSTSSLEDSIKIYNVQTGEIVKCKPEDKLSPRYERADECDAETPDKDLSEANKLSPNKNAERGTIATDDLKIHNGSISKISDIEEILTQLPKVKELAKKFVSMENLSEPIKPTQQYVRRRKSKENMLCFDEKADKQSNKLVYMHSLTARSISREFREELKQSMATPLTVPGGSKDIPEGIEEVSKESSRPGSPVPEPGTIKTKLAFFESLKSKFSNK